MGVVYKARQKSLDRLVALKLLAPERVNDQRFAERFSREAKALAVFDGLLFPLLALDALLLALLRLVGISTPFARIFPFGDRPFVSMPMVPGLVGLSLIVLIDIFIIRAVWCWVIRRGGIPASRKSEAGSPRNSRNRFIYPALAIAAVCLLGGVALLWIFASFNGSKGSENDGMLVMTVMPLKVIGRNAVVRVMIQDQSSPCEMRVVLDGPENPSNQLQNGVPVMPADLAESGFQGTFVIPRASPGNQPWFSGNGPMNVDIAFAFPTPELAQMAFRNIQASQPIDALSIISRRHTIMEAVDPNGARCTASLLVSLPIRQGDPKWVSINTDYNMWRGSSMETTWEVATSRQSAAVSRYHQGVAGVSLTPQHDNRRLFKTIIHINLYAAGPHRVRLEGWIDASQIYEEMDGDFAQIAQEFRNTAYLGSLKTEPGWETELCRIGGLPLTVQVTDELTGNIGSRDPATRNRVGEATLDAPSPPPR